jgi:hypothetical protein
MPTLRASNLTLEEVSHLLNFEEQLEETSFSDCLSLENLTEVEQQEVIQIRNDFRPYLRGKASEGQVKALTIFPLLRLAGFYRHPIKINIEEGIDNIIIEDEEDVNKIIRGRLDILVIKNAASTTNNIALWVLVIEAKESAIEVRQGLPQLLTYAYKKLEQQSSVWGLATNGLQYLFVNIKQGNPPTYQLMPLLDLMYPESSRQLLQVLKAICKLQNVATQA